MHLTCQKRKITLEAARESVSKKEMKTVTGCYDGRRDLKLCEKNTNKTQMMCWRDDVEFLLPHYTLLHLLYHCN